MAINYELRQQRFIELVRTHGGGKQSTLAERADILPAYVSHIVRGRKQLGEELIAKISRRLELPEGYFDEPSGDRPQGWGVTDAPQPVASRRPGLVPLISMVAAGNWTAAHDPYSVGDAEDWLPCPVPHGSKTYALRINGESMYNADAGPHEPTYADGDIAYFDPDLRPAHGDDVVVRLEDQQETTFKQLLEEGQAQYLKARNPRWPKPIIEITGPATFCGVCIGKFQDFRRNNRRR